jgi:transposase, IS605 orfB family
MSKIETTIVTSCVLYDDVNKDLYEYFEEITPLFAFLVRRTIHHLRHKLHGETETAYRTRLKRDYNVTNRFAKAVLITAKNLLKLSKTAGDYLYSTYDKKIKSVSTKIIKTKAALNNPKTANSRIKNLKTRLFWLEMRKNKLIQLKNNGSKPMLTLGTKKLLKSDKLKFLDKRDNQIVYVGSKEETAGNQQFQISYDKKYNKFTYKLRLENEYIKDSKYISGEFILKDKFAKKEIVKTLNNTKSSPLSFRIIKKDNILYLQILYRVVAEVNTRSSNGVFGVDFNKGFIAISEIDERGTLLDQGRINYIHKGKIGVTKNSMYQLVKDLVDLAVKSGKDIVIEDLKSLNKNKKEKTERKYYNRMINTLKFGRFRDLLQMKCDKCGVTLVAVDPYNTSKIAKEKYCYDMKLNIHSGASYVIARRFYNLD